MYTSKSFFDLLPPYVYDEVKEHIGTKINDFMNDSSISEDLFEQIKQNNWYNPSIATQLSAKDSSVKMGTVKIDDNTYDYAEISKPVKVLKGKDTFGNFVYSEMINVVSYLRGQKINRTMRLIGTTMGDMGFEVPVYVQARKKGYSSKGNRIVEYKKGKKSYDSIIPENNEGVDLYTSYLTASIKEKLKLNDYNAGYAIKEVDLKDKTELQSMNQDQETDNSAKSETKKTKKKKVKTSNPIDLESAFTVKEEATDESLLKESSELIASDEDIALQTELGLKDYLEYAEYIEYSDVNEEDIRKYFKDCKGKGK